MSSQIAEIDPARADPEGLATTAAATLVDRQLGERYAAALAAYAEGRSADALTEFEAVQQQRPGFREVDDLVVMLRQRLGHPRRHLPAPVAQPKPSANPAVGTYRTDRHRDLETRADR